MFISIQFQVGIMHIQLLHTSASLTINENWDPDVRDDMEMMLNRWKTKMGGRARDLLTKLCFLRLLSRPDKLCATTSNQKEFQWHAPLFIELAFDIPLPWGDQKSYAVYRCQCVVSRWCCCIVLRRRQLPSLPDCCCCANNCANFILCNVRKKKLFAPRLVPEQIPFKHSCEGPDDMPAHAKVIKELLVFHDMMSHHHTRPACSVPISPFPSATAEWPSAPGRWSPSPSPRSQGVWLCEHRDRAGPRKVLVTVNGVIRDPIRWKSSSVNISLITVVQYIGCNSNCIQMSCELNQHKIDGKRSFSVWFPI